MQDSSWLLTVRSGSSRSRTRCCSLGYFQVCSCFCKWICVSPLHALLALQPPPGEVTDKEPATSRADGLVQAQQALLFHMCVRETCQGHGYSILNFLVEGDIQLVQLRNLWAGLCWRGRVLDAACLWLICAWGSQVFFFLGLARLGLWS